MKITCESCAADYELDESRIPPSGVQMKCPACLHQFLVKKPAAAAPAVPKEIDLSADGDLTPLPPAAPGMSPAELDEMDLPAPKKSPSHALSQPADDGGIDLPAPKAASPARTIKAPAPAARPAAPPPMPPARKPPPTPITDEPTGDDSRLRISRPSTTPHDTVEDLIDLPAPVAARPAAANTSRSLSDEEPDLPAPRARSGSPMLRADEIDLPAPKRASVAVDLDAPDPEDLPLAASPRASALSAHASSFERSSSRPDDGMPGIDLESIDVVAPKAETTDLAPKAETTDLAPKAETTDLAPKAETMDLAPRLESMEVAPKIGRPADRSLDDPTPVEVIKPNLKSAKKDTALELVDDEPARRRGLGALIAAGAVTLIVGGVGVGLGLFTSHGWFGVNLLSGKRVANESKLQADRQLMLDDTLASYKKAALELKQLSSAQPRLYEAQALEAQARLCEARLGVAAELLAADGVIAKLPSEQKDLTPEIARARALKSLVAGPLAQARTELRAILTAAPSDATALTYLGWAELQAGDWSAAESAFGKALQAESGRAAALYGAGLANERLGKSAEAAGLYARALSRSADHLGAAVGAARLEASRLGLAAAQQRIEEVIARHASSAGPRELADAWATVGALASQAGQRDQAEDRLKRALKLDPESTQARMLMAQVQCDGGKAQAAIAPLRKILDAQPKNLEARLALVRALVEAGQPRESDALIGPAAREAPKDARVLYWQGRVKLADKGDKEGALALFKDAISADPRFIAAYLAESNTLALLGKSDDALDALKQAEAKASDDAQLMLELGQAYLAIHRAADAEARFRAALASRPEFLPARVALGQALEAQNKVDDAAKEYADVAAKQADYPGLTERLAGLATLKGRRDEAWVLYQKALAQGAPTGSLELKAAALALEMGKPDDARKLAEQAVQEDERSAAAHLLLARAMLAKSQPEEALSEARRAATLADLPEAHLALARALELLGRLDQAVQEYNLGRRPPVEGEASLGRARILVRMGATRDALADLALLARDPKLRARALLLQGDCFADLSQKEKARHAYEEAVKSAPDSGEAAFKLGRAHFDAGQRAPALAMLDKALKLGGDQAAFAVEAWLLAGDAHREAKEKDAAVRAYKKYLELAPSDAPGRAEVSRQLKLLEGG